MATDISSDGMERFSATGRPYKKEPISGWSGDALGFVSAIPQTLPWKYTDDDIISVPIRRPTAASSSSASNSTKSKRKSFLHKLFTGNDDSDVTVKKMTRGEYLKHYAKDEEGYYVGTEDPAEDCVLKEGDRRARHGDGVKVGQFSNDIVIEETRKEKRRWGWGKNKGKSVGDIVIR